MNDRRRHNRVPLLIRSAELFVRLWLLSYALVVVVAGWAIAQGHPSAETVIARQPLPSNHRISESDVANARGWHRVLGPESYTVHDVIGRYTVRAIKNNGVIQIHDTSAAPLQYVVLRVPEQVVDVDGITPADAGKLAELCSTSNGLRCSSGLLIKGIDCPGGTGRACSISFWIPPDERAHVLSMVRTAESSAVKPSLDVLTSNDEQT